MRLQLPVVLWLVGITAAVSACGVLDDCVSDRIEVTLPATVTVNGVPTQDTISGAVFLTNLDPPTYDRLVAALIDGSASTAGAVWTLGQGFDDPPGFLAFQLGVAAQQDAVLAVDATFSGGGWGFAAPSVQPVAVSGELGDFTVTASAGTAVVLDVAPLALRLALVLANAAGDTVRVEGDMTFRRVRQSVSCD
jgi:hypothetical protein